MEKQERTRKIRVPIQFWVDLEIKERADRVSPRRGDLSYMATTGFLKEIEAREREEQSKQSQGQKAS